MKPARSSNETPQVAAEQSNALPEPAMPAQNAARWRILLITRPDSHLDSPGVPRPSRVLPRPAQAKARLLHSRRPACADRATLLQLWPLLIGAQASSLHRLPALALPSPSVHTQRSASHYTASTPSLLLPAQKASQTSQRAVTAPAGPDSHAIAGMTSHSYGPSVPAAPQEAIQPEARPRAGHPRGLGLLHALPGRPGTQAQGCRQAHRCAGSPVAYISSLSAALTRTACPGLKPVGKMGAKTAVSATANHSEHLAAAEEPLTGGSTPSQPLKTTGRAALCS